MQYRSLFPCICLQTFLQIFVIIFTLIVIANAGKNGGQKQDKDQSGSWFSFARFSKKSGTKAQAKSNSSQDTLQALQSPPSTSSQSTWQAPLKSPPSTSSQSTWQAPLQSAPKDTTYLHPKVELSFGLRGVVGKVYVEVYTRPTPQLTGIGGSNDGTIEQLQLTNIQDWKLVFRTETLEGQEEGVVFKEEYEMTYDFTILQPLRFKVVQDGSESASAGELMTYFSEIVSERQMIKYLQEKDSNGKWEDVGGTIIVTCKENRKQFGDEIAIQFQGSNFDTMDSMYPYLILSRSIGENEWTQIDKAFMVGFDGPQNPKFTPLSLRISSIYDKKDAELQLKLTCVLCNYDDPDAKHHLIGEFETSYLELQDDDNTFSCSDKDNVNVIRVSTRAKVPTFLEILESGMEIKASVAIDFTASNATEDSDLGRNGMHEVSQTGDLNKYEKAIVSIVQIIETYDTDKQIPVMGFGGYTKWNRKTDHCFAVRPLMGTFHGDGNSYTKTGELLDENCDGTLGVLNAYRFVMMKNKIELSGPTYYAPSIRHIQNVACNEDHKKQNNTFFLLLLLTDGLYTDEETTKAVIAKASQCPMSIIIVGIGPADFQKLEVLDADNGVPLKGEDDLDGKEYIAVNDIVQHVPFKNFYDSYDVAKAMEELPHAVLEEFPIHVLNYFKFHNLTPKERAVGIQPIQTAIPKTSMAFNMKDLTTKFNYEGI